jgi:nicotinate-nucleotide pyrophosphorylase (carboxylating)
MQLQLNIIKDFLDLSFKEDFGIKGDITSNSVINQTDQVEFTVNCREDAIICGTTIAEYYFRAYSSINFKILVTDGTKVKANTAIITGAGNAGEMLTLERIILNFMQHLSGVATLTGKYVAKIDGTKAQIYDTRKTIPSLRMLQKYAVTCGGGRNHRLSLDSGILIKDNHIAIAGNIGLAIKKAKMNTPHYAKIEVECDTLAEVAEAVAEGVDIIMLDNMTTEEITQAIKIIGGKALIEVSGGVSLDTVADIAKTGVDMISVGKLTHSAPAIDIGLDIIG